MIEMGTDADPTRRVLLTKAIALLPHTSPLQILAPRCDGAADPAACRGRLDDPVSTQERRTAL